MIPLLLAPEGRTLSAFPALGADGAVELCRFVGVPDATTLDPNRLVVVLLDDASVAGHDWSRIEALGDLGALVGLGASGTQEPTEALAALPLIGWLPADASPTMGRTLLAGALRHAAARLEARRARQVERDTARDLMELSAVGDALITERDLPTLLDLIVSQALRLTDADAASLYLVRRDETGTPATLDFVRTRNQTRPEIPFERFEMPIDHASLAGHVALSGTRLNIRDVYHLPTASPFRFNPTFDERFAYRTKSMLVLPMRTQRDEVVGVLQLINRKRDAEATLGDAASVDAQVLPFDVRADRIGAALAAHAAVAVENAHLYEEIERLLEGFVTASVTAIESRDPTTSGHSLRVATLSTELAEAVDGVRDGPYATTHFSKTQLRELRYAGLLHDFGKVGVRESVLVKQKKLYGHDLSLLQQRIDLLHAQVDLACERERVALLRAAGPHGIAQAEQALEAARQARHAELQHWREVIEQANEPTILAAGISAELDTIGAFTYTGGDGTAHPLLDERALRFLRIPKGNLDPRERREIESHVEHTYEFLRSIPWTRELREIPTIAWGHHEKLDGSGYPRGVTGDQLPVQTRMMTIADIYDALTATDRPYKRALSADRALDILSAEAGQGLIDADLLQVFIGAQVFTRINPTDGTQRREARPSRPASFS